MRCEDARENLVAYLDGELTAEERERLDSHLAGCPRCRLEPAGLESTGDLLALLGPREPSSLDLAGRVVRVAVEGDPRCRHIRRELPAHLDGELAEAEDRPVEEHLHECEECTEEAAAFERTAEALALWRPEPWDADLLPRVLAAARPPKRFPIRRVLAAAAAVLLLLGGAFALRAPSAEPPEEVLANLDFLAAESEDLTDPALFTPAGEIRSGDLEWIEDLTEVEICMLSRNGNGG